MFEAMKKVTRNDSVFEEDNSVQELERHVAELTGHEAGILCANGTMTNPLGLRVHLVDPPHSVVCDSRSHVYLYENGGIAYHSRPSVSPVVARNGIHVTVSEIESNLLQADRYSASTRVVSLESTLHGMVMPLHDMQEIVALRCIWMVPVYGMPMWLVVCPWLDMVLIDSTRMDLNIQHDVAPALLRKNIKIGCSGTKSRTVLHHQIDKQGVDALVDTFREVLAEQHFHGFQQHDMVAAEA